MKFGRSIKIFLSDGSPSGLRHLEIANWSGQAIACPRSRFSDLQKWEEAKRPGVYFLFEKHSTDDKNTVYIGESENVYNRICNHDKNKDFWNEVIIFTSKDENLTKSHVKYLESRLTFITKEVDRYNLENGNTPTQSSLPRADVSAMEEYIENCRLLLGTLGHKLLEPINSVTIQLDGSITDDSTIVGRLLKFTVNGICALGRLTDEGFVLLKDSQVSKNTTKSIAPRIKSLRERLVSENALHDGGKYYVLVKDIIISSASYAASFVAGTARSGPQSWKDEKGMTMKDIEETLLQNN